MNHTVSHDLDFNTAKKCVNKAFESYSKDFSEYHPTMEWRTERSAKVGFSIKNMHLTGTIDLEPKAIKLDLTVPFLFSFFKDKAIKVIEDEIKKWLEKAKTGDL